MSFGSVQAVPLAVGQDELGQASGLAQRTSQLHAALQSMSAQAPDPEQSTAQATAPQRSALHAESPAHVMSQRVAEVQSTSPHARTPSHSIVHAKPAGQATPSHARRPTQSISQLRLPPLKSQDEQTPGQLGSEPTPPVTQKP